MVTRTLVRMSDAGRGPPVAVVVDVMWVHTRAVDEIEHIFVRCDTSSIKIVFFHLLRARVEAELAADRICADALSRSSVLDGWSLVDR